MSPELTTFVDVLMSECVTTKKVEARLCVRCNEEFTPNKFHPNQRHCTRSCQTNSARTMEREMSRELKGVTANIAHSYLHRDRYIPINFGGGDYVGPLNKSITWVATIAKDKGYHPMPIDVHVPASVPKFTQVTPEDVDWGRKQGGPVKQMPRHHNSFCACCVEMIIDKQQHTVRVTRGVYLPIEHECNSVRVYNLHGQLMETKQL